MASFTFIHAADLHLGSPLGSLWGRDPALAARFAAATREAFSDLVSEAIARRAAFVLVAGDIYDGDWTDFSIGLFFAREAARLARDNIPLALVRGNHDAESVVLKSVPLPDNVLQFPSARAATHRLEAIRVALHGRSFPDRAVPDADFAASYPDPVPGWFNVGLLHTSCDGHAAHAPYAPCTPADLARKGYDYWALGHVHDHLELSRAPPIVYPGNLQGRSVRECGPKGALVVEVVDGEVRAMSRLLVDRARWAHCEIDGTAIETEAELFAAVDAALAPHLAEAAGRPVAFRVTLSGVDARHADLLADREEIAAAIQAAAHRRSADAWLDAFRVRMAPPAAEPPALEPGLVDTAALLGAFSRDPELQAAAAALVAEVQTRLPRGMAAGDEPTLEADLPALCAEAEALVLARLVGGGR